MALEQEVIRLLTAYMHRNETGSVSYSQFLSFLERHLTQNDLDKPELNTLRNDTHRVLSGVLRKLDKNGVIQLERPNNQPLLIVMPGFFRTYLERQYTQVLQQPETPFLTEDRISLSIPEELIQAVNIKTDFIALVEEARASSLSEENGEVRDNDQNSKGRPLVRLLFPDGLPSIIASKNLIASQMVVACVQKIRHYLISQKNLAYIKQKITPIFHGREIAVKDFLQQILTSPDQSAKTVLQATDFSFQFWTHLSTNIIKEFAQKQDKLVEEQNYCQAAYLIGYYSVYCKGIEQKKKDTQTALKQISLALRKPPYAFTISEIHALTDEKGLPLVGRCSKEEINAFIASQLKSRDGKQLPNLMRTKLPSGKEYYVAYESVPTIIMQQLPKAQKGFRDFYLYSWQSAMLADMELETIKEEQALYNHLEERLKERFPLLYSVLTYQHVYLISQEPTTSADIRHYLLSLINIKEQNLKPYNELLGIDHKKLLHDVHMLLPFWMVVPVVKQIVSFFRRLFLGKEYLKNTIGNSFDHEGQQSISKGDLKVSDSRSPVKTRKRIGSEPSSQRGRDSDPQSPAKTVKHQQQAFKDSIKQLEQDFLIPGKNLDQSMKTLIERWNPLIDPGAKKNLVEDVNSMCRDFLRGLKISYRKAPPTGADIKEMAARLAGNPTFDRIRDRDSLRDYIELYVIKLLSR
ncbi:hypothetical protein [Spirochaeta lutea]|uniref:Uncharacterized protein n=1 Tax=Spirochaeta lutea TaxID=1480694 RepID=A0A098R1D1_9SPIO|nr:hypothetical protein [Spirochaeta lutea]KGE73586.1 hypothetical protein DC28_02745 [Spirochaeta lutea]